MKLVKISTIFLFLILSNQAVALDGLWFYERNFEADGKYNTGVVINFNEMQVTGPNKKEKIAYKKTQNPILYINTKSAKDSIELIENNVLIYRWNGESPQTFYKGIAITAKNAANYLDGKWSWDSKVCGTEYFYYDFKTQKTHYISEEFGNEAMNFSFKKDTYTESNEQSINYYKSFYIPKLDAQVAILTSAKEFGKRVPSKEINDRHLWMKKCE